MSPRHPHRPSPPPRADLAKRFRLFLTVIGVVLVLSIAKAAIHWLGVEFLSLNPLFTSAIAGAIFIIGFLLSSVLSDYKEAERIPAEIRVALEAVHDDVTGFGAGRDDVDLPALRSTLSNIVTILGESLGHKGGHADVVPVLDEIDKLSAVFRSLEKSGLPANFVVRLRGAQDALRRCIFRIYHIQKMQFVPSIHILVQTLVGAILFLLLFLKTEGSPESALIFGFVAYMFVYALYLIRMLEQPFRKGHESLDDVSLFLLREFQQKLGANK
jgi:hypothetical protein